MAKVKRTPGPDAERLRFALENLGNTVGKVGWFASSHYPAGTPAAYVAAVQEFGYKSIPPRLGMRATAKEKRREWAELAKQLASRILHGHTTGREAMELLGLKAAGDLRKHISQVQSPPLSPKTIAARRRARGKGAVSGTQYADKPLVATGYLLSTLTNTTESK